MLRIGAFARRVGMQATTVRAWERRYGLPVAKRTVGGQRLYDAESIRQVQMAKRLIEDGWSVQRAARRVAQQAARHGGTDAAALLGRLLAADAAADGAAAHLAAREAVRTLGWPVLVDDVALPFAAAATGRVADEVLGAHLLCAGADQSPADDARRVVVASPGAGSAALRAAVALVLGATGCDVQVVGGGADLTTLYDAIERGEAEQLVLVGSPADRDVVAALLGGLGDRLPDVLVVGLDALPPAAARHATLHAGPLSRLGRADQTA
jgi:DNA-binding transcriptional MerR regulator